MFLFKVNSLLLDLLFQYKFLNYESVGSKDVDSECWYVFSDWPQTELGLGGGEPLCFQRWLFKRLSILYMIK